jgi:hypothetical protein
MRLSGVLSKSPSESYQIVEHFLLKKRGNIGQQVNLDVGKVMLNYYCSKCEDLRTFYSEGNLTSIFVNTQLISIDVVLSCGCGTNVQVWFLVESENEITGVTPKVRIIKKSEKLSDQAHLDIVKYGEYTRLIEKSITAHREGLGAGAIVYLRKIFEIITLKVAKSAEIKYQAYPDGNPKRFFDLLKEVDEKCSIIPTEFSAYGYKLYRDLSEVIHGDYSEEAGLNKYEPLHRLVTGILDNIKNKEELANAVGVLSGNNTRM